MTTLESLTKKLEPLEVYNISEGSNISAELSAYAEALDTHRSNLDAALRECFISRAESYGLEIREKVIGSVRSNYSVPQRREMLKSRKAVGDNDFTPSAFDSLIKGLGVSDYVLSEMPSAFSLAITLNGVYEAIDETWITNQINLLMPAHLAVAVYLGGMTFQEIDSADKTFAQFDADDYTWDELENL